MKRSLIILLPAILLLAACGAASQYASEAQRFQDGIYYRPLPVVELLTEQDFRELAAGQMAADTLRHGIKVQKYNEGSADDDYYSWPYSYRYRYHYDPYWYGSWSYSPWHFWGPYNTFGQYYYDPFYSRYWDPYWDPYWYWGTGSWYYPHYYGYSYSPYYYGHGYSYSKPYPSGSSYSHGFVEGAGNHRRSGSMDSGRQVSPSGVRRSGIGVKEFTPSTTKSDYNVQSSGGYRRRSGGFTVSSGSSYNGSSYDYGGSTRGSGSYSTSSSSSSSSGSSSYSGGSSYSGSTSSGSSSGGGYSGGSGGGGGGRR